MTRVLIAAALLAASACLAGAPPPVPLNPVRFLLVNDVYVTDTMGDGRGGLARVATIRQRLADQGPVLFVLAGDFLSPSLLTKYYGGRQMIEGLNAAKLNYATFGNHEFDLPADTLQARISESQFVWISTNCTRADGTPFAHVLPWDTVRVSGHEVGLFGITLLRDRNPEVLCSDPDSAAHRAIEALQTEGADLVIGITHQSAEADRNLLVREPNLDLILGGHEHTAMDSVVSGRHIVKADANARSAQFVTLWGGKGNWREAVGRVEIDSRLPEDSAVAAVTQRWEDSLVRREGPERVVGYTTVPLDARNGVLRRQETPLGTLVADAIRAGVAADVALLNSGAIRIDDVILPGPITNHLLESIFLFADGTRIVTVRLTGAELRAVLEHGLADGVIGSGGFLQVSGLAYAYDPGGPSGSRIRGPVRAGGVDLAGDEVLTVAVPVYLACRGGDGFRIPAPDSVCEQWQSAPRAVDLLARYVLDSLKGEVRPPAAGRVTQVANTNPG